MGDNNSKHSMTMSQFMHIDDGSVASRRKQHEEKMEAMLDAQEEADRRLAKCLESTAYRMAVADSVHAALGVVEMLARCGEGSGSERVSTARFALDMAADLADIRVDYGGPMPKPSGHGSWDSALAVYTSGGDVNG